MYNKFFKRFFDLIGSFLLLPFVLCVIIILAPIIYLTAGGPLFYNATRLGLNGKKFTMFKLRSMYVNAPDLRNEDGSTFNSDYDKRVTAVGNIMRKTSLDEFPQFLNVLIGDMSFVGPRPMIGNINYDKMNNEVKKRFSVKPGITGYAQAYFRNSITQDEKIKCDAYYADHITLWLDIKILFMTVWSVMVHQNINTEQSLK